MTARGIEAELQRIIALLPPCPTCDGRGFVDGDIDDPVLGRNKIPCPDCVNGKVPIEQLVALYNIVHDPEYDEPGSFIYVSTLRRSAKL